MTTSRLTGIVSLSLAFAGSLAVITGASREQQTQTPTDAQPVGRKHHAVAYHRGLQRVVTYGGASNDNRFLDDFWSFDGQRWTLVARGTPNSGHHMFSDNSDTFFMVGGLAAITATWDGGAWVPLLRGPARWGIAGAYDVPRRRFVLHGGCGGRDETFGDTLEFDGTSWSQAATDGPPARGMAAMVFDSARNIEVLFGGMSCGPDARRFDDLWEWDGVQWRGVEQTGERPPGRNSFAMAYDQVRREVVLFGGLDADNRPLGDTWLWNGGRWRRQEGEGPSPRDLTEMAFDAARGVTVLFGGDSNTDQGALGDTWEWDGSRWLRR
jgi:hypothetical protein